ncbi:MAG TPA: sigma-70 family RNA polymerase sigma factor [Gemmatimonadaceae bacterium]|nr:sigma-70 family RNA polymerase sigma factor [Gemmatimonadaceae bacterium]
MAPDPSVTQALLDLSRGERAALDRLLPVIYEQLHRIAERELRRERPDHTLSPTALVHEAYLKLVQLDRISWQGRDHFFGACSQVMRRILISYARMKRAEKRGGPFAEPVTLENAVVAATERPDELVALDEALSRLAVLNGRQASVVECRFFGGMDVEQTAHALNISPATVKRDWALARAWLNRELVAERGVAAP